MLRHEASCGRRCLRTPGSLVIHGAATEPWKTISQVNIDEGADQLIAFQHPTKRMKRFYCSNCGETLFNSNAADWRVVSQLLIRKCYGGELPEPLHSKMHFFYARRIVDVADDLPKRD